MTSKKDKQMQKRMTTKALMLMGSMQDDERFRTKLAGILEDERAKDPKGFERGAQIISRTLDAVFDEYDADKDLREWVQKNLRVHAEVKA